MGCVSSIPVEGCAQRNIDNKSNYNYNHNPYSIIEGEPDLDKMSIFIKKYKLDQLSLVIYNERITVDFLLSQNKENIIAIAEQLSDNIIQQNKFIYAVNREKIKKTGHAQQKYALSVSKSIESISCDPVLEKKSIIENEGKIRIFIKSSHYYHNQSLPVFVSFTDSISNVLNEYQRKYNIIIPNINMQTLMYCGQQMMNNKDLKYYHVIPEDELYLIHKNKECINIFIKTQRHKICIMSMMVLQNVKIKKLKREIEKKWGISSENQRLNYKNKELNDDLKIFDYDISHNDTIYLMKSVRLCSVFINIKSYKKDNKWMTMTIDVEEYDTIKSIKLQIKLYFDIPIDQQRLIYLDKELLNLKATVKSSNICDGDTLEIY